MGVNTYFRICKATDVGQPAEPPFDAWPLVEAPPVVRWPVPKNRTGLDGPATTYGLPQAVIGRNQIEPTGLAYYNALFANTTTGSALVKTQLYDLRTCTWGIWEGILWRPTVADNAKGGYKFQGFRAMITALVPSSWT